ncbi:biopolymer transporter ExbD [Lentisphaera profundi]|uniref:Biopolymer transporter ExbD n=1 Tax=Lentisphaera profundi TaxID=1658616 RepID=A0ABY7VRQ6_9BACT|nr:biopolymer transporter ExbD [Lentisphaera profundi]WDE95469.1 biopolymer transporter ExbD [Lentisphaera profundi]
MADSKDQKAEGAPISSLIDVVFLLIMFFVATAQMDQEGFDQNVQLAIAFDMEKITQRAQSQFPISILKDGVISTGPGTTGDIAGLKRELSKHVGTYGNEVTVIIRPDKNVKLSLIDEVMSTVGECGVAKINISAKLEQ